MINIVFSRTRIKECERFCFARVCTDWPVSFVLALLFSGWNVLPLLKVSQLSSQQHLFLNQFTWRLKVLNSIPTRKSLSSSQLPLSPPQLLLLGSWVEPPVISQQWRHSTFAINYMAMQHIPAIYQAMMRQSTQEGVLTNSSEMPPIIQKSVLSTQSPKRHCSTLLVTDPMNYGHWEELTKTHHMLD